jgi:hypothetical protein
MSEVVFAKIIEVNERAHGIVVRYWTSSYPPNHPSQVASAQMLPNGEPERCSGDVAIDMPIPLPAADGLRAIVKGAAPRQMFARWAASDGVSGQTLRNWMDAGATIDLGDGSDDVPGVILSIDRL